MEIKIGTNLATNQSEEPSAIELSPIPGDGLMDQAAA
jgi:hypothetical protein